LKERVADALGRRAPSIAMIALQDGSGFFSAVSGLNCSSTCAIFF
jgi:hypothetical protein